MNGSASTVDAILDQHRPAQSQEPNILRTLLAVQDAVGYVPLEKVGSIARALGVTESDIAGVISYYPDVRTGPSGRHIIRICMGESCFAIGRDRGWGPSAARYPAHSCGGDRGRRTVF